MTKLKKQAKKRKNLMAYSLLEVLATLSIVSIIIVMLTNVLVISLDISRKAFARSQVREEQNNLLSKIEKDIRNASFVGTCGGTNETASCEIAVDKIFYWTTCSRNDKLYVCKKDETKTVILDGMSENIEVKYFSFEPGVSDADGKKTIVITMSVAHTDEKLGIDNQLRQIVVSTRNYSI